MATPTNDTYEIDAGIRGVSGGRVAWPAWRHTQDQYTWASVASNTLSHVDPEDDALINPDHPSNAPWHAISGLAGAINAWCGGTYNDDDGDFILPLGGGHADYAGNEPYRINLMGESPAWEMMRNPSGAIGNEGTLNDGQESTGVYFDGRPRAIHSYNKHVWVPDVGVILPVQGGSNAWSGQAGTADTYSLDLTTWEWTNRTTHPGGGGNATGDGACYDSLRHRIWWIGVGNADMSYLDIDTWTWTVQTTRADVNDSSTYQTLVYVPTLDLVVQISNSSSGGVNVWAADDLSDRYTPSFTGSSPGSSVLTQCGASWCPELGAILLWNNSTATETIYTITPPATNPASNDWVWGALPVAASNAVTPTAKTSTGTYGRFGYSSKLRGCYLLNAANQSTYFFAIGKASDG